MKDLLSQCFKASCVLSYLVVWKGKIRECITCQTLLKQILSVRFFCLFYLTIISDEITLFIAIGALTAPFSVLHMMVIIRNCICLQNLTPSVALHIPVREKTKAIPCLSFMFASFRCLHYSVDLGRQERKCLETACVQIFQKSVPIALKPRKGSGTRPAWVCGRNWSRFLNESAFSSFSNNSVNMPCFSVLLFYPLL